MGPDIDRMDYEHGMNVEGGGSTPIREGDYLGVRLTGDARADVMDDAWRMYQRTYGAKGGATKKSSEELLADNHAIEVLHGPDSRRIAFGMLKQTPRGMKLTALMADGSPEGKQAAYQLIASLNRAGRYGELSDVPEIIARRMGVPTVPAAEAEAILGKPVTPLPDGIHYERTISGLQSNKIKAIYGKPQELWKTQRTQTPGRESSLTPKSQSTGASLSDPTLPRSSENPLPTTLKPPGSATPYSEPGEVEHGFSGNTTLVQAAAKDLARIRNLIAPQTAGDPARFAGNLLRELGAKMANEMARADKSLRQFRNDFDRTRVNLRKFQYDPTLPLPRNFEFINAYESGNTSHLAPGDAAAALEFHRLNAADVARVHALGTGALTTFYRNYFPHIWDDPDKAATVFGKILGHSPLEGPKSFLKQRTYQLFEQGLAAGLKPVHDNPVDLWMLKKREVERYILARNFTADMKAVGLMKFKYAFGKAPDGWTTVNDSAFSVYGPPTVTIKEAFDAGMRESTLQLLSDLGVPHERLAKIGGQRWGYERETPGVPGSERIVTKFAGPDSVIWHELGHVLDNRYPELRQQMKTWSKLDPMSDELKRLAAARTTAASSAAFMNNVQSTPEKMAVILQAYVHAPDLMQRIAPLVKKQFDTFIDQHPELHAIRDIRPTLRVGEGEAEQAHGGLLKLGDYVMPDQAANLVRNYLSPGLNPHLWYRTLRQTSNLMNGVQLGLSGFHLGFTSLDAATSRLAVALEDAVGGKIGQALKTAVSVPISPFTNIAKGAKLRAEVLAPGTHPELAGLVKALEQAGGRVGQDAFWQTEFTRRMVRAWNAGGIQYGKALGLAPFAAWEQTMRPILEYVVPRQKLGVFADMASRELLKLGPNAQADQSREALRKVWDSVDNRMGQMTYDNLFYNRAVKDLALLSFRAYGWQLGKYREGLGALADTARAAGKLVKGEQPKLLQTIQSHAPQARLIWADTTPLKVSPKLPSSDQAEATDERITARNSIACKIMQTKGVSIDDLSSPMSGHPEYHSENVHFNDQGVAIQAAQVAAKIEQALSP